MSLLCLVLSISLPLSLTSEPWSDFLLLLYCWYSLSFPERRLFFHFSGISFSLLLALSLWHTLSDSNQTSNYSNALRQGLHTHTHTHMRAHMRTHQQSVRSLLMLVTPQAGMPRCPLAHVLSGDEGSYMWKHTHTHTHTHSNLHIHSEHTKMLHMSSK